MDGGRNFTPLQKFKKFIQKFCLEYLSITIERLLAAIFEKNELSVNNWIIIFVLLAIPIVNIIFLIIWASNSGGNISLRNFSRAFFKLHLILIIIVIAFFVGGGNKILNNFSFSNDSPFLPVTTTLHTSVENKIKFSNLITKTDFGFTTANGEVTNTDDVPHSFSFIVSFYDENKKLIGTANGIMDTIGSGQTKTFEAISTSNLSKAKNYKIDIDFLIQ